MAYYSPWTNSGLEKLIDLVNKLRDCCSKLNDTNEFRLDLPQIAVVGGQSAGKSSVLENFVGREFLPRGSGIVTRRPLILQLVHSNQLNQGEDFGEFQHAKGRKWTNFEHIKQEIERETARCTGSNKAISPQPIYLRIYSQHVLNLTLIDLPGLTKVPIGDQPANIEQQIRQMILTYIKQQNCLILAVTPANQDLATSDALKLAKEVDPDGLRTIGVLTKLDLMDEGTNGREILLNKQFPLKRGYIGVVCRSQKDIEGRLEIGPSLEKERAFFTNHPAYSDLAHMCGTQYLQQVLNKQLVEHIRDTLPELNEKVHSQMMKLDQKRVELNLVTSSSTTMISKAKLMLQMIGKFASLFERNLFGSSQVIIVDRLSAGARLNRIFHEIFPLELNKPAGSEREILQEVTHVVRNTGGIRTGISSDLAFEMLAKKRIESLREPIFGCIQLISREIGLLIDECVQTSLASRPRLAQKIASILRTQLNKHEQKTMEQMSLFVDIQLAYMNTYHEDLSDLIAKSNLSETITVDPLASPTQQPVATTPTAPPKKGWFIFGGGNSNTNSTATSSNKQQQQTNNNLLLSSSFGSMKNLSTSPKHNATTGNENLSPLSAMAANAKSSLTLNNLDDITNGPMSQALETRIMHVRRLVDAYLQIVRKTLIDLLVKTCNHFLVNGMNQFIGFELHSEMSDPNSSEFSFDDGQDQWSIMEESAEAKNATETFLRQYEAHKQAIELLNDINLFDLKQTQPAQYEYNQFPKQPYNQQRQQQPLQSQKSTEIDDHMSSTTSRTLYGQSIPPLPPRTPLQTDITQTRPIGLLIPENQSYISNDREPGPNDRNSLI